MGAMTKNNKHQHPLDPLTAAEIVEVRRAGDAPAAPSTIELWWIGVLVDILAYLRAFVTAGTLQVADICRKHAKQEGARHVPVQHHHPEGVAGC